MSINRPRFVCLSLVRSVYMEKKKETHLVGEWVPLTLAQVDSDFGYGLLDFIYGLAAINTNEQSKKRKPLQVESGARASGNNDTSLGSSQGVDQPHFGSCSCTRGISRTAPAELDVSFFRLQQPAQLHMDSQSHHCALTNSKAESSSTLVLQRQEAVCSIVHFRHPWSVPLDPS